MRLAAVDLGSNSTRLLIADLDDAGRLTDVERRSTVTRLGHGVDRNGRLDPAAVDRVAEELVIVRALLDRHGVERAVGVMTSAVRDAEDGGRFEAMVRDRFAIDARTISGTREAELTYRGATAGRDDPAGARIAVVDIGGGSTEIIVGDDRGIAFSTSVQAGVVRHGERFLAHDPPESDELVALAGDARGRFAAAVPPEHRTGVDTVIAVAGTATTCATIDLEISAYDPDRVHGYRLPLARVDELLAYLSSMDVDERARVTGLDPSRAPTIVPGCVLLAEVVRLFDVRELEASDHDILRGIIVATATGGL
ncbi:MAG: Ppx/GppA family phosphatase [Solirubrobacteraceae bacterium]|nr:Ppx/GppA family phosphatase [Solirubrobacteraceae bacterium]